MKYGKVIGGTFVERPNRFTARVTVNGEEVLAHIGNTGRCRELLLPGSRVWLTCSDNTARKTKYDLIAVEKQVGDRTVTVNIDSQAPNRAAEEWLPESGLFPPDALIRREVTWGDSRFDFCIEHGGKVSFLEVKGVTLEADGIAMFPDAPTERGLKHVNGLIRCAQQGLGAYILFVVQMKGVHELRPNDAMHSQFGDALRTAEKAGVRIIAVDCCTLPDSMSIDRRIPVITEAQCG